jgi:hypothetical protein
MGGAMVPGFRCGILSTMKGQKKTGASKTVTLRLDSTTLRRLDRLAEVTDRSKASLAAQAVKNPSISMSGRFRQSGTR